MIIFRQKDFGLSDSRQDQLSYLIDGDVILLQWN